MARIKGQETVLRFTHPQGPQEDLEDVKSFEAELDVEILQESYLGQTTDEYDDIYHGVSGQVTLHLRSKAYFQFTERVQDRAERRSAAGGVFSATTSFAFPNGERVRLTFQDIFFGPLPIRSPERKGYVEVTISWKGKRMRRVL
jgi:hypothetical protein